MLDISLAGSALLCDLCHSQITLQAPLTEHIIISMCATLPPVASIPNTCSYHKNVSRCSEMESLTNMYTEELQASAFIRLARGAPECVW